MLPNNKCKNKISFDIKILNSNSKKKYTIRTNGTKQIKNIFIRKQDIYLIKLLEKRIKLTQLLKLKSKTGNKDLFKMINPFIYQYKNIIGNKTTQNFNNNKNSNFNYKNIKLKLNKKPYENKSYNSYEKDTNNKNSTLSKFDNITSKIYNKDNSKNNKNMINLITGTNNFGQYLNINHFSKTKFNSTLATSSFNKTKKFYPHFNTINLPKISFNNTNEQKLEKNEDINNNDINNNDNDNNSNNQIYNNLTESEFEKIINEHSKGLTEEKFFLLVKGKIKEIETELGDINQSKKKDYISQKNQNIIYKPPLYFSESKYTYFGTWSRQNLQKEGWGILIDEKGNKYEGGFKSDKIDGYGRLISINGDYYEGELKMGNIEGTGIFFSAEKEMLYKGSFKNNFFDGNGHQTYQNIDNQKIIYEGEFKIGKREGKGKLTFSDGNYYEGEFKNDKFEGEGYFKYKDGREYNGYWKNNEMNGKGEFTWGDNKKYNGEYKDSRRDGFGIYYFGENDYYEGNWLNNLPHGEGKICNEGKTIEGYFRFGKLLKKKNNNKNKLLSSKNIQIENGNGNDYMRRKSKK